MPIREDVEELLGIEELQVIICIFTLSFIYN